MEDLFAPSASPKLPELTVTQISTEIKRMVENTFGHVRIRGEIFGSKRADSGHYYLSLKDENAVISAVCWKGVAAHLMVKPEDGLEVIATGKITTFAGKSSYQLVIEDMEVAGAGALLKLLEERKQKFAAEGLFDQRHKKAIPYLPRRIGVITSASGAVIRDIIHRVRDRFPSHIIVWPTPVQGEGAADKIAAAINGFNQLSADFRPDVLIVARGGGSLEDLWAFNEEVVIRAVFAGTIPLISAVGHETDTMLIDYVSDLRAPTPTGAAEFAIPVKIDLMAQISNLSARLFNGWGRYLLERRQQIIGLARGIPNLEQLLHDVRQRFDDRIERLRLAFQSLLKNKQHQIESTNLRPYYIKNIIEKKQENLNNLLLRLQSVSIDSVLKRGFAWVKNEQQKTIYNIKEAKLASSFEISFYDGSISTADKTSTTPKKIRKENVLQDDLFDI